MINTKGMVSIKGLRQTFTTTSKLSLLAVIVSACMNADASVADECLEYGGDSICVPPLPPKADSDWEYVLSNPATWGADPAVFGHKFSSEKEALKALNEKSPQTYTINGSWFEDVCSDCVNSYDEKEVYAGILATYDGTFEKNNSVSYVYNLADRQLRWLITDPSEPEHLSQFTITKYRKVKGYQCALNQEKVFFPSSLENSTTEPFLCKKPSEPEICPTEITNNPIDSSCGNPIDIASGNKRQIETDWKSPNSRLSVRRRYNSLSINIGLLKKQTLQMGIPATIATSPNGWQFQGIGQRLTLVFYGVENNFNYDFNTGQKITSFIQNGGNLANNHSYIYIQRPGLSPDRFYLDLSSINHTTGESIYKNEQNNKEVTLNPDGSFTYLDKISQKQEQYNQLGQLLKTTYINGDTLIYSYHSNGYLPNKITDQRGQSLQIQHDGTHIQSITLPTGKQLVYGYDGNGNLTTVKRPGYAQKQYIYEYNVGTNDDLMIGIIDENGKRYATFSYDSYGRGISTEHANQTQKYQLAYFNEYGKADVYVTTPYKREITYTTNKVRGKKSLTKYGDSRKWYDQFRYSGGNLIAYRIYYYAPTFVNPKSIWNRFAYNDRNLEISRVIAEDTPESTITLTEWHATLPVKTKITEGTADTDGTLKQALRMTRFTHDDRGNILTKTITDPQTDESRTWTYTYNANNQKLSETDPTGLTQYWDYNDDGYLKQYTDPQGLVTIYSNYNTDGKPQTITSPTGQISIISYDEAGRIVSQGVQITAPNLPSLAKEKSGLIKFKNWWRKLFKMPLLPNPVKYDVNISNQTATTSYEYDGVGQLIKATLPDGEVLTYSYDDAHRLIAITDSLGNQTKYTLNGAGNIIQTDSYDPQGVLANSSRKIYNDFGDLENQIGNNGQDENYQYDGLGKLLSSENALNHFNQTEYDILNRKTQDINANGGTTQYEYDGLGNLIKVTDPKGNATTYSINAFGETLQQTSPDTGLTLYQYQQGRLTKVTDSEDREQNYHYDDKGRLVTITDNNNQLIASYHYDNYGRISKLSTANTSISYIYNSNNQIIEKKQTANQQTLITRYAYSNGGKQTQIRLPSGKLIEYHHNTGILQSISVKHDDKNSEVINNLTYSPNGITGYTWGQTNQAVSYEYDLDGRLTNIADNAVNRNYNYDVGNRITRITDNKANINFSYQHDKLDRLYKQVLGTDSLSYVYDKNSNRTQKTEQGNQVNTPVEATSNKYTDYSYDNSGRVLSDGVRSYSYNNAGRIKKIINGSQSGSYYYNALGQRVKKTANGQSIYFNYDESGQLIGEYNSNGNAVREYIYLGNQPIALFSSEKENEVLQIHTDHLGTPRAVTNANKQTLWKWEGDAFGSQSPQVETVKMPLRMAGQYFDSESELFYNYFRYYDPKTGRYVTSDPIGLEGGLNTFGYVGGSPLLGVDPYGLIKWKGTGVIKSAGKYVALGYMWGSFNLESECVNGKKAIVHVKVKAWPLGIGTPSQDNFDVEFTDYKVNTLDATVFNGKFSYRSGGVNVFGGDVSSSGIQLGGAFSTNVDTNGGLGLGATGTLSGKSKAYSPNFIDCECNK